MPDKIKKLFYETANWICVVSLVIMVVVTMIVVVGRYCFNYSPAWGEEVALFFMTWVGLFSASIAEHDGTHIRLSFIEQIFPPVLLRVFGIIRHLLKIVFFTLMTYFGIKIFLTTKQMYASVSLSYRWAVLPGIATAVFCLVFTLLNTKKVFMDKHEHDKELEKEALIHE